MYGSIDQISHMAVALLSNLGAQLDDHEQLAAPPWLRAPASLEISALCRATIAGLKTSNVDRA